MSSILIVEDTADIREWVTTALELDHHTVRAAVDGEEGLTFYKERKPDLIILDVMMPKKNGWQVLREIRERDKLTPIMMLTARSLESDKVQGLAFGADDYMTKPFGVRELRARVAALLRRAGVNQSAADTDVIRFGTLKIDVKTQTEFSKLELAILKFLSAHPNEVVGREKMIVGIWGNTYDGTNRTLDTRVASLRKKLGPAAKCIQTIYGEGYKYVP